MKRFLMAALVVAGMAHGIPAAQADDCDFPNPLNPKCWTTGAAAFEGQVTLDTFPCAGGPECTATFNATVTAGAGVTRNPGVSIVTGLSANVTYNEVCTAGQALEGSAAGTATLSGINVVGSHLPFDAAFTWTRVGLVAVVTGGVVGAAVFVPTTGLPTCTGGSVTAVVAGAFV